MRERSAVCPHLIISKGFSDETGWFNYLHCDNDFGSNAATIKAMELIGSLYCVKGKTYYLNKYFCCTGLKNSAELQLVVGSYSRKMNIIFIDSIFSTQHVVLFTTYIPISPVKMRNKLVQLLWRIE